MTASPGACAKPSRCSHETGERLPDEDAALLIVRKLPFDEGPEGRQIAASPDELRQERLQDGVGDELTAEVLVEVPVGGAARGVRQQDRLHHGRPLEAAVLYVVHALPLLPPGTEASTSHMRTLTSSWYP